MLHVVIPSFLLLLDLLIYLFKSFLFFFRHICVDLLAWIFLFCAVNVVRTFFFLDVFEIFLWLIWPWLYFFIKLLLLRFILFEQISLILLVSKPCQFMHSSLLLASLFMIFAFTHIISIPLFLIQHLICIISTEYILRGLLNVLLEKFSFPFCFLFALLLNPFEYGIVLLL